MGLKICLLSASVTGLGGAEAVVRLLATGLMQRGHEVVIFTLDKEPGDAGATERDLDIRYFNTPVSDQYAGRQSRGSIYKAWWQLRSLHNPRLLKAITAAMIEFQPDIIHTHKVRGFPRQLWPRLSTATGCSIVHTCHDIELLSPAHTINMASTGAIKRVFLSAFRWLPRSPANSVSLVTSPSAFMLNLHLVRDLFAGATSEVIPNFHDLDTSVPFNQLTTPEEDDPLKLLFVGRLVKVKGILTLCEGVARLSDAGMNITLRIAGDGELRNQVETYSADHSSIEYLGPVTGPAKSQLFDWCHVVTAPAEYDETFCIVAAESITSLRPVFASGRGGLPEVVEDGNTGWIFQGEGVNAIMEGLSRVIDCRPEFESYSSRCAQVAGNFSPENIFDQYESVYRRLFPGEPSHK